MKKKTASSETSLKENMINQAVLTHWWGVVQAVETLRANPDDTVAAFQLGTTIQCLIFLSLKYGSHRLLKALPPEQGDVLESLIHEGPDLARDALGNQTPLFPGTDFPAADSVFELMSQLMIGASTKPEQS